jgi:hypothetical protein
VTFAERSDRPVRENLAFTCAQALMVQDIGDFLVAMVVKKAVDGGDDVGLELADVSAG